MSGIVVLSRSLDDDRSRRAAEESLATSCTAAGLDVLVVPSLYHLPDAGPLWEELAALEIVNLLMT
jgi:uroporphyrinogen-III synthase